MDIDIEQKAAVAAENKGITDPKLKVKEIIDLQKKESAFATKKNPYHETGSEIVAHPKVIEELVRKGFATKDAPKEATADKA